MSCGFAQSLQGLGEIGVRGFEDFVPFLMAFGFHEEDCVPERLDGGMMIAVLGVEATFQPEVDSPLRIRQDGFIDG